MNFLTKPKHTVSSVIREIVDSLNDGSISLQDDNEHNAEPHMEVVEKRHPTLHIDLGRTNRIIVTPNEPVRREVPGLRLRALREQLGLTMRDVETASARLAAKYGNTEYIIPPSRLDDIETKGVVPSVFRFYTLAVTYHRDVAELLGLFGVELAGFADDLSVVGPPEAHTVSSFLAAARRQLLTRFKEIDPKRTANMGQIVDNWGIIPLTALGESENSRFTYAYIGAEDLTMYPMLLPGSFVQVDESLNRVVQGTWRSEYERPIYFVETREGFTCCWCALTKDQLILQPHPLSPVPIRVMKWPQEADIVGQVVAVAIDFRRAEPSSWPTTRTARSELIQ